MSDTRMALFTETNSLFGAPLFRRLLEHPGVDLVRLVVREEGRLCDNYIDDDEQVDLAEEGAKHGIRVLRPRDLEAPEVLAGLRALEPDFFLVGNYQKLLRTPVLQIPRVDTINFHPRPLPKCAGLAPFYWMAAARETDGGVSAIRMNEALDDGPIVAQQLLRLRGDETEREIRDRHFEASWRLFDLVLPTLIDRSYRTVEQDVLESLLVPVLFKQSSGVVEGRAAVDRFLQEATRRRPDEDELPSLHRSDTYAFDSRRLIWEYPRQTPGDDQLDLVEVMELDGARITRHRIYWGWKGLMHIASGD